MESSKGARYFDFCEELNFKWSSLILLIFVSVVGVLRYAFLTSLITCLTPEHFRPIDAVYVHQTCWSKREFSRFQSFGELTRPDDLITFKAYHTWIPVMLSLMLLGFQAPRLFKFLTSGIIGNPANLCQSADTGDRSSNQLAEIVKEAINQRRFIKTVFHFITKLLICINLLVQLVIISAYYRSAYNQSNEGNAMNINSTQVFPTTVLCNFTIMQRSNTQHYTLQCDVPANSLYENFFYVFLFWILFVGIYSGLSLIVQFFTLVVPPFVKLRFRDIISERSLSVRSCSFDDGLLHLMYIQNTSGVVMAREVAKKVWETQPDTSQYLSPTYQQHHDTSNLIAEEKM